MDCQAKSCVSALAIRGGKPAFREPLHVGQPNLGKRETFMQRVGDILDRRWLTNDGPLVKDFEMRISEIVGVKHCIAVCNGTIALEIAIRALELRGEVIMPAFTFIATAHALQWQEITPVFADIDATTHLIDPALIERLITPRTTGILGVHLWGQPCDVEALERITRRHGLRLLFDAAHAFACTYHGGMIGSFGEAEVFSFHATKFINSLEGGAVVTNNDELARKVRLMRNFGFEDYDRVGYIGTNGKMNEMSAAMGITSLESLSELISINHANYRNYAEGLRDIPGIRLLQYDENQRCNFQYIVVEVDRDECPISRNDLVDLLWTENIRARRYFYPGCHRMEPYRAYFPNAGLLLRNTELVAERVLILPTGQNVSASAISTICQIIRLGVEHTEEVSQHLRVCSLPVHPKRADYDSTSHEHFDPGLQQRRLSVVV
jgi:dTDP-4-amino-4,6-dideoxygalactose transaminase